MLTFLLSLLSFCSVTLGSGPDQVCLQNALNSTLGGTVDLYGNPTTNISQIAGITYDRCVAACGYGPVDFNWPGFSAQFTSWLLPWLALISQLPHGSGDALSSCLAVLLTVGSPTLAAYSLALAVISNRWMVKRFELITYPNSNLAAQTLGELQQVSLIFPEEEHVLPSLIVLPANEIWWRRLAHGLDYMIPTWTLASVASVLFVVLADIFNWVGMFFSGPTGGGGPLSSLWLCFLPILIGYLQLSPKSQSGRIRRAFNHANSSFHVTTDEGKLKPGHGSLLIKVQTACRDPIDEDEISSAPIFFYARALSWLRMVRKVADGFDAASQRASDYHTDGIPPSKRQQVIDYCKSEDQIDENTPEFFNIFLTSAFLAILLQWGTTGIAMVPMYLAPPKGLCHLIIIVEFRSLKYLGFGCRAGAYLLYTCVSTLIWLLCVVSSILSHSYKTSQKRTTTSAIVRGLSIAFRRMAKVLATVNAIGLFVTAIYQYSNLSNDCWCISGKLSLRQKAYVVVIFSNNSMGIWILGFVMSFLAAGLFLLAINLLRRRPERPYQASDGWEELQTLNTCQ